MDYMQLGLVLGLYQGLKYGERGFEKLASAFFNALAQRNAVAHELFEEAAQRDELRKVEIVTKMLEFLVNIAQESTPSLAPTFSSPAYMQRAKEYAALGMSNSMFEAFTESWLVALEAAVDAEDCSDRALEAWRYLLNLCVAQLTQHMPPRQHADRRRGSDAGTRARSPSTGGARRTLVKTPTVNERLRERAASLTQGHAPFAKEREPEKDKDESERAHAPPPREPSPASTEHKSKSKSKA